MTKQQKETLRDVYSSNKNFIVNGKKLNLSFEQFVDSIEKLIFAFGDEVSESALDDCLVLIGASYLAGYRGIKGFN